MQQEMQHQAQSSYGYEGERTQHPVGQYVYDQKLIVPVSGQSATPGQRLALAIVSLCLLVFLIFGLVIFAIVGDAPNWAVIPILFIILLFSVVATAINFVFNRRA